MWRFECGGPGLFPGTPGTVSSYSLMSAPPPQPPKTTGEKNGSFHSFRLERSKPPPDHVTTKRKFLDAISEDLTEDETTIVPSYYITSQNIRLPATPIVEMPEEKKAQIYSTHTAAEYEQRYINAQATLTRLQDNLVNIKRRRLEVRNEMLNLLRTWTEIERELVEANCKITHAVQSLEELAKRYKKM